MPKGVVLVVAILLNIAAGSGVIQLGGATFPAQVYEAWQYGYTYTDDSVAFNYNTVGSTAGVNGLVSGLYQMAGTDSASLVGLVQPPGEGELIPLLAGAVVPAYNVQFNGTGPIILDGNTLVQIFLGKISYWSDPAIQALNPTLSFPDQAISLLVRSDGSGTSNIFTSALASFSADWPASAVGSSPVWPASVTKHYENAGVASAIHDTPGSIGYCGVSYAIQFGVAYAQMTNQMGQVVSANVSSVIAAIQGAVFDGNFSAVIVNSAQTNAWPISGFTYVALKRTTMTDCNVALDLVNFLRWTTTDSSASDIANEYGFVLVTSSSTDNANRVWSSINQIQCNNVFVGTQIFAYQKAYYGVAAALMFIFLLLMLHVAVFHNLSYLRRNNWSMQILSMSGAVIMLSSVFVFDGTAVNASCHLQIWLTVVGSSIFYGRIWAKSVRPWRYLPGYTVFTPVDDYLILATMASLLAIEVVFCIIWSSSGNIHATALNTCASDNFWGYFSFIMAFKYFLLITGLIYSVNTPASLSYFGETVYMVQASAAAIVITVLFLPIIFLAPVSASNLRQVFSPSVLIMTLSVVVTSIITAHKVWLQNCINKARRALANKEISSSVSQGSSEILSGVDLEGGSADLTDPMIILNPLRPSVSGIITHEIETNGTTSPTSLFSLNKSARTTQEDLPHGAIPTTRDLNFGDKNLMNSKDGLMISSQRHDVAINMVSPIKTMSNVQQHRGATATKKNLLEKILLDPAARVLYRQILTEMHCIEVLDFWFVTKEYSLTPPEHRLSFAKNIVTVYIQSDSTLQINLTHDVRAAISKHLRAANVTGVEQKIPPQDLFEAAGRQAFEMMQGIFVEHFSKHSL